MEVTDKTIKAIDRLIEQNPRMAERLKAKKVELEKEMVRKKEREMIARNA